jgi:hypothetical protein
MFIDLRKGRLRREVSYNILVEFELPMRLGTLTVVCLNEICSSTSYSELSEKGNVLSPLLFTFTLECAIMKAHQN